MVSKRRVLAVSVTAPRGRAGRRRPRILTALAAALTLAAGAAGALGAPDEASAACARWQLPLEQLGSQHGVVPGSYATLRQGNGWLVSFNPTTRRAYGWNLPARLFGRVTLGSFTAELVKFTITWDNGSGGVYTGTIDPNGFVSGTTVDRWKPTSRSTWRLRDTADCVAVG